MQSSTRPTAEGKAANPTLESCKTNTQNCHAGLDRASSLPDPGLCRDDGQRKCCYQSTFNSQKGMTLVEVLVAAAILAIGLLAIASMQKTAIMVNMRAYDITEAADLAQSRLEYLMSLPYSDDLAARCGDEIPCKDIEPFMSIEEEQRQWIGGYNCQCSASTQGSGNAQNAKVISVTVSALDGGSSASDYIIKGVKAKAPK